MFCRADVPEPPVLQCSPGPRTAGTVQHPQELLPARPRGRVLPGAQLHSRSAAHACRYGGGRGLGVYWAGSRVKMGGEGKTGVWGRWVRGEVGRGGGGSEKRGILGIL